MAPVATVQPPTSFSAFKFNNLITAAALTNQPTNQIHAGLNTLRIILVTMMLKLNDKIGDCSDCIGLTP